MDRVRLTFWPVVGIIAFIASVLCGLGLAAVAVILVVGVPHAIPPSPGIATILFLLALLFVVLGFALLRRSIRALSATRQSGSQKQVRRSLYAVASAALLVVIGAIVFPWCTSRGDPSRVPRNMGTTWWNQRCGAPVLRTHIAFFTGSAWCRRLHAKPPSAHVIRRGSYTQWHAQKTEANPGCSTSTAPAGCLCR